MPYPKSKSRALLTLAAGASSALVACGKGPTPFAGIVVMSIPDSGEDANFAEGCDACGMVALPPDSGPDAGDARDADEPSTDAAADAQDQ